MKEKRWELGGIIPMLKYSKTLPGKPAFAYVAQSAEVPFITQYIC